MAKRDSSISTVLTACLILFLFGVLAAEASPAPKDREMKKVWLIIRDDGHYLVIAEGHIVKVEGRGKLKLKQDGRLIEITAGQSVTVDGRQITRQRTVNEDEI